jgi:hypothetical protein
MSFLEGLGADATLLDVRVQLSLLSLSARRVDLRRWQTCLVVLPIPAAAASARATAADGPLTVRYMVGPVLCAVAEEAGACAGCTSFSAPS